MDSRELLSLYRDGRLAARKDDVRIGMLREWEVMQADLQELLVGTNGYATVFAKCSQCVWQEHAHFETNNLDDVEEVYRQLSKSHRDFSPGCLGELRQKIECV